MKLTINHNGFHGLSSASIIVSGKPGETVALTPSQIKRLGKIACGISDCRCYECMVPNYDQDYETETAFVTIPESGNEINLRGNYPQN